MNSSPAALNGLTSKDPAAEQFVVQIRNLNYYYGQGELCTQVLHNINLDLRGQIVIMTGPSGSVNHPLSLIEPYGQPTGSLKVLELVDQVNRSW